MPLPVTAKTLKEQSLLAIAVYQPTSMLNVMPSSRASFAPTGTDTKKGLLLLGAGPFY
jgi:hypothetical protein